MQTFLPFADFYKSAEVLDNKHLGKQRVENYQILNILVGSNPEAKWRNHPAVLMWKGYEAALCYYSLIIIQEWLKRGFKDTLDPKIRQFLYQIPNNTSPEYPFWFGDEEFHISHQSNLLRKDLKYYSRFFPNVPDNLPYKWPVRKRK